MVFRLRDQLHVFGSPRRNNKAEPFIRILHENNFELYRFRKMGRSFEDCEKMFSWETECSMGRHGFMNDKITRKTS